MKRSHYILCLILLWNSNLIAQSDTSFIDNQNAVVRLKDSNYENFDKVEKIKRVNGKWRPQADTIYFKDGNIFRIRNYFHKFILITIDSFYQHPYNNLEKVLTTIAIGIGDVSFVQSIGEKLTIKSLSIQKQNDKRKEMYYNNLLSVKPGSTLNFSDVIITLDRKYNISKITLEAKNAKKLLGIHHTPPMEILFNKNKVPIIRFLE